MDHQQPQNFTIVNTTLPCVVCFPYINFTVTNATYCPGCWHSCVEIKCILTRNRGAWNLPHPLSIFSSFYGHKVSFSQLHGKLPLITVLRKISSAHILNANKEGELQKGRSVILTISLMLSIESRTTFWAISWEKESNWQLSSAVTNYRNIIGSISVESPLLLLRVSRVTND